MHCMDVSGMDRKYGYVHFQSIFHVHTTNDLSPFYRKDIQSSNITRNDFSLVCETSEPNRPETSRVSLVFPFHLLCHCSLHFPNGPVIPIQYNTKSPGVINNRRETGKKIHASIKWNQDETSDFVGGDYKSPVWQKWPLLLNQFTVKSRINWKEIWDKKWERTGINWRQMHLRGCLNNNATLDNRVKRREFMRTACLPFDVRIRFASHLRCTLSSLCPPAFVWE